MGIKVCQFIEFLQFEASVGLLNLSNGSGGSMVN